ncbi:hypothetical protein E4P41_08560 [Geodermatophilus sp. DF01-2]|uniref:hypothetical protein n=1 Tax=Geodermatophilus sp. DF01-2 TaxID=2559610 RepID=UPI001073BA0D|nr:hypothetical protein [Geodermatophilus sp. DF01_2]TFV62042.1 hypothetical protein E4P41_08560 [Geodermatophilus sp. DF01_2]
MTSETLIVHDGRVPGGTGAVVLARLLRRQDARPVTVEHLRTGQNAHYFWTVEVDRLLRAANKETKLVLFGVTFYDLESQLASTAIDSLREAYGDIEVWSHRWPDGYSQAVGHVNIPPQDIVYGPLGFGLTPPEKRLLRLSLVAARAVPVADLQADVDLANALQDWVGAHPENWERLVNESDLELLLQEARDSFTKRDRTNDAVVVESHADYLEIDIDDSQVSNEIAIIDDILIQRHSSSRTVVVAWLGANRVLLCRRDPHLDLPSLRWLIDRRFQPQLPVSLCGKAYGPQDAVYFRLAGDDNKATLRQPLRDLAKQLAGATTGGRYLTAALARDIASLANNAFRSLDLTGKFTRGSAPSIEVAATDLYDLAHTSSRTGERRRTLTMPIRVRGPKAIAFFFIDGGYNFQKAERFLEGAVLGLGSRGVAWLGLPPQSGRLRLDVQPMLGDDPQDEIAAVRQALLEARVKSVDSKGLVTDESVIGRFLSHVELSQLVTIADSETIGPSVAHALTLMAAADAVADGRRGASALDLFAGSGVAHRLLSLRQVQVTSVDLYVSASSVGLEAADATTGLWLRADARAVLDRMSPLIERNFDVIGLDPPHSELVELLFGAEGSDSLVHLCARRSDLLVLYQGHSTQRGRLVLVTNGLREAGWVHHAILQVEEEIIVVAATDKRDESAFRDLVSRIVGDVQRWCDRHGMEDVHAMELSL